MNMHSIFHAAARSQGGQREAFAATASERPGDLRKTTARNAATPHRAKAIEEESAPSAGASPLTRDQLEARVQQENAHLAGLNQGLTFRVHEGSGQLLVQVVDRKTGEVVREAPPSEFLDLAVRMREMVGAFLDETS